MRKIWPLRLVALVRFILYLVIAAFFVQQSYFGSRWAALRPAAAATFIIDIGVVTAVVVASGGFNSIFVSFYFPLIFIAGSWLPRRFTAVFPSVVVLGLAFVALGHFSAILNRPASFPRQLEYYTIVSTFLIFSVLFFVVAYLAGMPGQGLFVEQRLNATVLESMTEGVAVVKKDWRIVYANSEFVRIFPGAQPGGKFAPVVRALFPGASVREFEEAMPKEEEAVVTLSPLLGDVAAMLARTKEGTDVAVTLRVGSDDSDDPEVQCDADRLMEVLFEDNGPGLPEKEQGRIFAPFFTARGGGTGMGLAVSRKQVSLHGGTITAENRAEGGARFTVRLPPEQVEEGRISGRFVRRKR